LEEGLGSGVAGNSDGVVVGLALGQTDKKLQQVFGDHAVGNAVLDPLLEVD
jgi:hypothetical protein